MGCKGLNFLMCTVCSKFDVLQSIFSIFFCISTFTFLWLTAWVAFSPCSSPSFVSLQVWPKESSAAAESLRRAGDHPHQRRWLPLQVPCWGFDVVLGSWSALLSEFTQGKGAENICRNIYIFLWLQISATIVISSKKKKKWKIKLINLAEKENKGWQFLLQGFTQHVQSILGLKALSLQK